jgi:hypothetical protein
MKEIHSPQRRQERKGTAKAISLRIPCGLRVFAVDEFKGGLEITKGSSG